MTGTGVIAAQKGGCLFIAERKGQRHTHIGSDRDLERKPVKLARPRNEPPLARVLRLWRSSSDSELWGIFRRAGQFSRGTEICAQRNYIGLARSFVDSRARIELWALRDRLTSEFKDIVSGKFDNHVCTALSITAIRTFVWRDHQFSQYYRVLIRRDQHTRQIVMITIKNIY